MLTVKDLYKTYKTKGGAETKALNGVSITFPESGMVFLLGKSGSGKSTLLNVCGGLDTPDSGEIVILGKSSREFSGGDFDSYRNTFVGFIFQEYNLLNEFSVEENLALALELQGKNKNKERVNELLEQVDLAGFGRRKPNTLSGGQKQRIAIARALIKDPKIIMADEPTGALDSATGRQVLDTLKKLSETRLVIIVSHDREFAEMYGDRIIELKDGKVISDVSKEKTPAENKGDTVEMIVASTQTVKSGKKLSAKDIEVINDYISRTEGNVIISGDADDIISFKKANRIDADNNAETFIKTRAVAERSYSEEESRLVRSKLPVKKAVRMGASSLKVKPFRLFITILLTAMAFLMFGVSSTLMTYDGNGVLADALAQSDYYTLKLQKKYNELYTSYTDGKISSSYTMSNSTEFNGDEFDDIAARYGNDAVAVVSSQSSGVTATLTYPQNTGHKTGYGFDSSIDGIGYTPEGSRYRNMVAGTYPESTREIAISDYYFKVLKYFGLYEITGGTEWRKTDESYPNGDAITLENYGDAIGKYLLFTYSVSGITDYYIPLKITGIYNAGDIPERFDGWETNGAQNSAGGFSSYISDGLYGVLLTEDGFYEDLDELIEEQEIISSPSENDDKISKLGYNLYYDEGLSSIQLGYAEVYDADDDTMLPVKWLNGSLTELNEGQIILGAENIGQFIYYATFDVSDEELPAAQEWNTKYSERYSDLAGKYIQQAEYYRQLYEQSRYDPELKAALDDAETKLKAAQSEYDKLSQTGSASGNELQAAEDKLTEAQNYYDLCFENYNNNTTAGDSGYYEQYYYNNTCYNYLSYLMSFRNAYLVIFETATSRVPEEITEQTREEIIDDFITAGREYIPGSLTMTKSDGEFITFDIVGYHYYKPEGNYNSCAAYVSEEDYTVNMLPDYYSETSTNYVRTDGSIYSAIFVNNDSASRGLLAGEVGYVQPDDSFIAVDNTLASQVDSTNYNINNMKFIFLYIGIAIAVFASLLLFNFISVSIRDKMHEIGVLRAVGARGMDVFKIFIAESLIITAICLLLSIVGSIAAVYYLNAEFVKIMSLSFTLFSFGILPLLMMLAVALVVAFLGTFIPVWRIAHRKPVDSMHGV